MAKKQKPLQGPPDLFVGEVRRIVASHPRWNATEKELYSDAKILILGRRDVNGANEVLMLTGRLRGELRWIDAELMQERSPDDLY